MPRRKTPKAIAQGLNKRLSERLGGLDWTVADLVARLHAQGAEVHHSTVTAWFSKSVVPDAWLLLITCRVMKIDIEWALTGEGSSAPRKRMDTSEAERNARLSQISGMEAYLQGERARILSEGDAAARAIGNVGAEAIAAVRRQEAAGLGPDPLPARAAPAPKRGSRP